jgi:hypothetical protein
MSCSIGPVEFNPLEVSIRRNLAEAPQQRLCGNIRAIAAELSAWVG